MMREVHIEPVSNGFIVTVGCQRLVFNSIEEVAERLIAYQKDPEGEEKKHFKNAINKIDAPQPAPIHDTVQNASTFRNIDPSPLMNAVTQ